jgi:hypothetical protein
VTFQMLTELEIQQVTRQHNLYLAAPPVPML